VNTEPTKHSTVIDFRIVRAKEYIEKHFADPNLSLGQVSVACGLSRWHLSRTFKRQLSMGVWGYLRKVRLAAAMELLQSSALSIKEITNAVGYQRTGDLDRHIKQSYGVTPSSLRGRAVLNTKREAAS
jgi:AraC-like DNA-binding protein